MTTQAARQRFRLFTYRHPATWSTIKRTAVVGATVGALALRAKGARRLAVKGLGRQQALREKKRLVHGLMRNFNVLPSQGRREYRKLIAIDRALPRLKRLRRAYDVQASRYGRAAKIAGVAGVGYAGMPIAREVGHRRYYKAQTKNSQPVTVIHRRLTHR